MEWLPFGEQVDRLQALALGGDEDVLPVLAEICDQAGACAAWWMRLSDDGWSCVLRVGDVEPPADWEARCSWVVLGVDRVVLADAARLDVAQHAVRWLAVAEQVREGRRLLAEANGRYQTLRQISFEGICVHRNGVLIEVNQSLASLYGYTREEMLGMSMRSLVAPEVFDRVSGIVQRGFDRAYETVALCKDGERIPLEARGKDCLFEGEPARVASFRDLRERKKAELALVAAQQAAERSSQLKTAFLGNISHELRTPMHAVLGAAHLVLQSELDVAQRELMERLQGSAQDLLGLVNDLLDITRIEEGRLELASAPFALRGLVDAALRSMRSLAEGVRLTVEIADDLSEVWVGDEPRVRQILVNLLDNAAKFTSRGSIALRVRRRPVGGVQFEVTDTGIGIGPEQLARVFNRFEQADSSTTRSYGGSGLGLHICRELASHMGGVVVAESALGRGSTFRLALPLLPHDVGEEVAGQKVASAPTRQVTLRVLLAEDNPVNQLIARRLLESMGHEVEVVANGQQAVDAAQAERFDAILMDIQMPVLDGLDATRKLRAHGYDGPVIALTAHAMQEDHARCLEAGMDFYLTKPIHIDGLARLLQSLATESPG